jgi:hypothetical protein
MVRSLAAGEADMLNAILDFFVFGFVAVAALGHLLVFVAVVFGRSERATPLGQLFSWFHRVSARVA